MFLLINIHWHQSTVLNFTKNGNKTHAATAITLVFDLFVTCNFLNMQAYLSTNSFLQLSCFTANNVYLLMTMLPKKLHIILAFYSYYHNPETAFFFLPVLIHLNVSFEDSSLPSSTWVTFS